MHIEYTRANPPKPDELKLARQDEDCTSCTYSCNQFLCNVDT